MPYEFTNQYTREPADFYVEPPFCTERLLDKVMFEGIIHDPASGIGTIPKVAAKRGYSVSFSDIVLRSGGCTVGAPHNYITDYHLYDNIVTNPPYNLVEDFAHHALGCTRYKIALLTRLAFLEGQRRYKTLFSKTPPSWVLVFSTRPSMPPYGKPVGGGKTAYCWVVWDLTKPKGEYTKLDWII